MAGAAAKKTLWAEQDRGGVLTPVSLRTRLKVKNTRGIFRVCCTVHEGHKHPTRGCYQRCERPGFPGEEFQEGKRGLEEGVRRRSGGELAKGVQRGAQHTPVTTLLETQALTGGNTTAAVPKPSLMPPGREASGGNVLSG
eukprot:1187388-Prorocentrum_minimum.AAC.2